MAIERKATLRLTSRTEVVVPVYEAATPAPAAASPLTTAFRTFLTPSPATKPCDLFFRCMLTQRSSFMRLSSRGDVSRYVPSKFREARNRTKPGLRQLCASEITFSSSGTAEFSSLAALLGRDIGLDGCCESCDEGWLLVISAVLAGDSLSAVRRSKSFLTLQICLHLF